MHFAEHFVEQNVPKCSAKYLHAWSCGQSSVGRIDWASILCKNAFLNKIEAQSIWYFLQNTASRFINENLELKEGITLYAIGAFC